MVSFYLAYFSNPRSDFRMGIFTAEGKWPALKFFAAAHINPNIGTIGVKAKSAANTAVKV